jgi:ribosome-associated translation inhibitor RaiA
MATRIVTRHEHLTEDERVRLRELSGRISRYFRDVVSLEWTLTNEGPDRIASCRVHSRSGYYGARASSDAMGKSIDQALDRVIRQRRRRKVVAKRSRRELE